MKLQKKIFRAIVGILLGLSLVMSATTTHRTVKAFEGMERRFFEQDMFLLQKYIDDEVNRLTGYVADWGAWDAMYSFMETRDNLRFEELLTGMSLRALDIDFLAVLDRDMNIVVGYMINELGGEVPLSNEALRRLKAVGPQFLAMEPGASDSGPDERTLSPHLMNLDGGTYLFGSNPILMTNWSGPARGVIIVGGDFAKRLKQISETLGNPCEFLPVSPQRYPDRWSKSVAIEESAEGQALVWQTRGAVIGTDTPYALMIRTSRDIYNEGKRAVYNSYLWIFLNGIVVVVAVMELLSRLVLNRLEKLREVADTITEELSLSLRVPVTRDDEISDLSRSFNVVFGTLEHIVMNIPDAMILCTPEGGVILANLQARRLLGLEDGASRSGRGMPIEALVRRDGEGAARSEKEQDVYEAFLCSLSGVEIPVEIHQRSITFGKRRLILFLARDLTDRKRLEMRLAWKLYYDDLTGLPNRTSLVEAIGNVLKKTASNSGAACRTALALVNMDHFKSINAEVGDVNGDRILVMVAERLKATLDGRGAIYRTGGDEFALLIGMQGEIQDRAALLAMLERARDAVNLPCEVGEGMVYPSASIGVLSDVSAWNSPSVIIEKAASALKNAKKAGLGAVIFFEGRDDREEVPFSGSILNMRAELQSAIENDEFIPYFQPVYSIKDRELSGFETLVRWMHPQKGFLPPSRFVPYAERIGLVGEIDRCMMRRAMEAIGNSSNAFYFSANGSSNLLQNPNAADIIRGSLNEAGIDPSCFVVEVTESVLIDNLKEVSATLDRLRETGVRIFLDDFGTGYSSLQYIHSLPLDCIKLDMAFVRHVFDSEKETRMLRTIIDMANALNLDTIAEGVETEEQLSWLGEAGCGKAQGFYFSKPLSWADAEKLIRKERAK